LQRYFDSSKELKNKNINFDRDIFPQIEKVVADTFRAVGNKIDPNKVSNFFEVFGFDFMFDTDFKIYLIEVNSNPSLETCCPLLYRLIPELLDNTFRMVLDPYFQPAHISNPLQPPSDNSPDKRLFGASNDYFLPTIKYTLVFDDQRDQLVTPQPLKKMAQQEFENLPANVRQMGDADDFYDSGESERDNEEED